MSSRSYLSTTAACLLVLVPAVGPRSPQAAASPAALAVPDAGTGLGGRVRLAQLIAAEDSLAKRPIRNHGKNELGNFIIESSHFRVVYDKDPSLMEKVARAAEEVRHELNRKWFGVAGYEWDGKCTIYLYPDQETYLKRTKSGALAHFRSSDFGGVLSSRAIHLPLDADGLFEDVLPHEVAHSVMALRFNAQMPRWADEGIASLAESKASRGRRRQCLLDCWSKDELFALDVLMQTQEAQHFGCVEYYAQSMSLIEFLVAEKGWKTFFAFLRDGVRNGYRSALQVRYGIADFAELERRWRSYASRSIPELERGWVGLGSLDLPDIPESDGFGR